MSLSASLAADARARKRVGLVDAVIGSAPHTATVARRPVLVSLAARRLVVHEQLSSLSGFLASSASIQFARVSLAKEVMRKLLELPPARGFNLSS